MIKQIKNHIKVWERWKRGSKDSKFYKFLVLLGLAYSPGYNFAKSFNREMEKLSKLREELGVDEDDWEW